MLLTCSSYEDMFGILYIVSPVEGATSAVNERTLVFPPRRMSMITTTNKIRMSIILFIIKTLKAIKYTYRRPTMDVTTI